MASLNLSDTELSEMKDFYREELDRTEKRLVHIKGILTQLGGNKLSLPVKTGPTSTGKRRGRPPKKIQATESVEAPKIKKKPGRKSQWEAVILKRLRQLNKPVTYDELTDEIMVLSKLSANKRTSTKQAIVSVVFRLRNRDEKLDTFSVGKKEKYIALKQWFDKPGEIKKEYSKKVLK
ncbi:hypothetical protein LCGC14_2517150 [marine sediment metagenome]|uniref:Uncharacterized protein n=1 Tax=marine sediment metagenome TaxID=412755 RepID=A0A0F9D949_9ZZZZ